VLYRTNAQSRIFEETLRRKNIPYKIYGGLSFYERKEIKDILAYFRMVINPLDEEALKRTVNYPKRGIGDTTVHKLLEIAMDEEMPIWGVLEKVDEFPIHFNAGTRKKLAEYRDLIRGFASKTENYDAYLAAREISMGSGMMRELREGKTPEEISRFENFEELMNGIKVFTEAAETNGEPTSLQAYLQNVALLTDQDNEDEEDRDKVTLMTMHSAKGLEFNHVYITGMEDTLFPSPMSSGNPREIEEERRLFYVAITRARTMATLTYALNRYKWGNLEHSNPSRFLREIDQKYIDYPQITGKSYKGGGFKPRFQPPSFREEQKEYISPKPGHKLKRFGKPVPERLSSAGNEDSYSLAEGDNVIHERFGAGVIIEIDGEAPNTTALVEFEGNGRKKLLLRFAKLKKL
jgi:DNA helicase-2/ATP-dependent DNA helicase PcrA